MGRPERPAPQVTEYLPDGMIGSLGEVAYRRIVVQVKTVERLAGRQIGRREGLARRGIGIPGKAAPQARLVDYA